MSGALVDLVAIGVQDTYLTGDPQTTYFRQAYKRHTNFAMEPVRQVIEGDPNDGGWSQVTLTRSGDLLTDVYFLCDGPAGNSTLPYLFDEVQLYIGGQQIDTLTPEENSAMADMFEVNVSSAILAPDPNGSQGSISLQFFFGRGYSCALPLCALQYHDVTLRIKWRSDYTTALSGASGDSYHLYADYVQLDTPERNAFASKPLTMLVEQHQRTPIDAIPATSQGYSSLTFSHPVKAIYACDANVHAYNGAFGNGDGFMKLEFNGKERTPLLPIENYFYQHQMGKHTEHYGNNDFYLYSFALWANRLTPTGSCNFSRLDNARLSVTTGASQIQYPTNIYALNWNFLKLEDGMGGLLYAN